METASVKQRIERCTQRNSRNGRWEALPSTELEVTFHLEQDPTLAVD